MVPFIDLNVIKAKYKAEQLEKHETDVVVEAIFKALEPHFDLLVTVENMYFVQQELLPEVKTMAIAGDVRGLQALAHVLFGVAEAISTLNDNKKKFLTLWQSDHYFLRENRITDEKAVAAYYRGNATIGELFFHQPSIFIG